MTQRWSGADPVRLTGSLYPLTKRRAAAGSVGGAAGGGRVGADLGDAMGWLLTSPEPPFSTVARVTLFRFCMVARVGSAAGSAISNHDVGGGGSGLAA